ncbi:mast cell-expressed membrane protein 1 [Tupaia chinensis]|uniref:mast cell-expressed membrane protein 1 n=1 Tax=Tupaia chinensis TaxID=246437 RepID=UPI000FFB923A|nr:mast cell-expressed membrane protein 1 [Tupaia chinensis]
MQAAALKDKKRGASATKEGDNDPDYENITLAFRNRDPLKSDHSPRSPAPAQPRPLSDSAQIPPWLHKAIMILYVLLAFTFAFCIILSVLLLVKNSEMSQELLDLRGELWNVSNSMRVCQEEQQKGWNLVWERVKEARESILQVDRKTLGEVEKLKTLPTEIAGIKENVKKILDKVEQLSQRSMPSK